MTGHTKDLKHGDLNSLARVFETIRGPNTRFETLRDVATRWRANLQRDDYLACQEESLRHSLRSPSDLLATLSPYHREKVHAIAEVLRSLAENGQTIRAVDVGCGTGELITFPLMQYLRDYPNIVFEGLDIDAPSVRRANDIVNAFGLERIRFSCGPSVGQSYDCVICTEVIEHQTDPVKFAVELRNLVAGDGTLILTTPNGYGYGELERRIFYGLFEVSHLLPATLRMGLGAVYRYLRRRRYRSRDWTYPSFGTLNYRDDAHLHFFTQRRLRYILSTAGFETLDLRPVQVLGGIVGGFIDRRLNLNRFAHRLPPVVASDWILICRPAISKDDANATS